MLITAGVLQALEALHGCCHPGMSLTLTGLVRTTTLTRYLFVSSCSFPLTRGLGTTGIWTTGSDQETERLPTLRHDL